MAESKSQCNSLWCVGSNDGLFGVGHQNPIKTLNKNAKAEWSVNRGKIVNKIIANPGVLCLFQKNKQEYYLPKNEEKQELNASSLTYFKENNIDIVKCCGCAFISREQDIYFKQDIYFGDQALKMSFFRKKTAEKIKQVLFVVSNNSLSFVVICESGMVYYCFCDESTGEPGENTVFKELEFLKNITINFGCAYQKDILTPWGKTDRVYFISSKVGNIYVTKDLKNFQKLSIPFFDNNHIKILSAAVNNEILLVRGIKINSKSNSEKARAYLIANGGPEIYEKIDVDISVNDVSYVSCGDEHWLLKTSDGMYYLFGSNEYGQCLADNAEIIRQPRAVNDFIKYKLKDNDPRSILQIEVCGNNTFILIGDAQENDEINSKGLVYGEYLWKISDTTLMNKMKSAEPGKWFKGDVFYMHGMQWFLEIYPNGCNEAKRGRITVFCKLKSKPSNIESVKTKFKFKIPEMDTNWTSTGDFDEKSDGAGFSKEIDIKKEDKLTVWFVSELLFVKDRAGKDCTQKYLRRQKFEKCFESVEDDGVKVGNTVKVTDSYKKLNEEWKNAELPEGYDVKSLLGAIGTIIKIEEDDDTIKFKWEGGKRWIPIRACVAIK